MVKTRRCGGTGVTVTVLMAVAAITLGGCGGTSVDPIDWYRNLSGASVNDPKDKGANSTNLAEGDKEPYPNLASVPKEPDTAITKAAREKMAQSLIADRQNAQYTDQQLRAGQNMEGIAPPPLTVGALPSQTAPIVAPAPAREPPPRPPVAAPRAPVKTETLPTAASAPPPPPPPEQKAEAKKAKTEAKKKDQHKNKEAQRKRGSEAPPQESSLEPPTIDNLPRGEEAQAAPPPPAGTPAAQRHARPSRSEEVAAAAPAVGDEDAARPQAVTGAVARINFAPAPFRARILPAGQKRLVEIARMAAQQNVRIRVVGYGTAPAGGDKQQREFQSFNAALDNAKAVGVELAKLGVPPNRIDIETATDINASDRAEVFVEY